MHDCMKIIVVTYMYTETQEKLVQTESQVDQEIEKSRKLVQGHETKVCPSNEHKFTCCKLLISKKFHLCASNLINCIMHNEATIVVMF